MPFATSTTLRGDDARPWLLGIVRNACFTMLERTRNQPPWVEFDEAEFEGALGEAQHRDGDPAAQLRTAAHPVARSMPRSRRSRRRCAR